MTTNLYSPDQNFPVSERDFSRAIDSIPQIVWSTFPDGAAEFFNQRWVEYTGLTAEDSRGFAWQTAIHPEDLDELNEKAQQLRVDGVAGEATARVRRVDGIYRWFLIRVIPLRDEQDRIVRWYGTNTDIDDWKRAEAELRRAEERFRLAAAAGKMFAYEWDAATDAITRSAESVHILGIDETIPFTGQEVLPKVHPDDREKLLDAMSKLSPQEPYLRICYRMIRPDGKIVWVDRNSRANFDAQGKILRIIGMIADITERKQAEEALQRREAELAESQRLARVGSWRWELDTNTVTWSKELYRLVGLDPDLPPVHCEDYPKLYTEESWNRLSKAIEETFRNGTPHELDVEMISLDGAQLWVVVRGEAQRDNKGRIVELHGTVQDFTARKQTEEALRESEERFRLVANSAPVLVWMADTNKRCTYVNQPWIEFTGRMLQDAIGDGWMRNIHPEDARKCLQIFSEAFDQRELFRLEYRLRRHDGEYRWVLGTGVPRHNADGSFAGYIGSAIDVTERKKGEEALATVRRRLIEAQEKERRKIARELHDDICQRLALLAVEVHGVGTALDQSQLQARSELFFEKASGILADVQSLSHRLHSSKLETLGLVAAMKGFCDEFAEQQKVEICFTHSRVPDPVPQEISVCLFRILQEGLLNAFRHSGVKQFEAHLRGFDGMIELRIHDSGKGFDPDAAETQHGLGIVSMRERVGLAGGTISIASKPLAGTEIRVLVPVAASVTKTAGASSAEL